MRKPTKEETGTVLQLHPKQHSGTKNLTCPEVLSHHLSVSEQAADAINGLLIMFDNQRDPILNRLDDFFMHFIRSEEYDSKEIEEAFCAYSGLQRIVRAIQFIEKPNSINLKKLFHVEH